jgi:glycogen phosphorylase
VAEVINYDPATKGLLNVHFIPDYRVSQAELIIPAADLSEQISTAGTEASGTGNMKFALNGALTIGTMDGANIEIHQEVGEDNIFIFGMRTNEVMDLRRRGYNPREFIDRSPELKAVMQLLETSYFSPHDAGTFRPIYDSLLTEDRYMIMADFDSYIQAQREVDKAYLDKHRWARMSILNVAHMGMFSSDRTIKQYNDEIWHADPVEISLNR